MDINDLYVKTYMIALAIYILIFPLEAFISYKRKDNVYNFKEARGSILTTIGYQIIDKLITAPLFLFMLLLVSKYAIFNISTINIFSWIICFILLDFIYYIDHRLGHEIRFFWSFHNVHHTSNTFNLSIGSRLSWFVEFYRWSFLLPLAFIGFSPEVILYTKLIQRIYATYIHLPYFNGYDWLGKLIVTPSHHKVHHGKNPQYINKNYGSVFIIWDKIFGTFEPEKETVVYGITDDIDTYNPLGIQFTIPKRIFNEVLKKEGLKAKINYLFFK